MWCTGLVPLLHVESFWTRNQARVPCIGRQILIHCGTRELLYSLVFYLEIFFRCKFPKPPVCLIKWLLKKKKETCSSQLNRFHTKTLIHTMLPSRFSCVRLCATPWTAAYQASPSMGFSRQEHWSGLPFPSPIQTIGTFNVIETCTLEVSVI